MPHCTQVPQGTHRSVVEFITTYKEIPAILDTYHTPYELLPQQCQCEISQYSFQCHHLLIMAEFQVEAVQVLHKISMEQELRVVMANLNP